MATEDNVREDVIIVIMPHHTSDLRFIGSLLMRLGNHGLELKTQKMENILGAQAVPLRKAINDTSYRGGVFGAAYLISGLNAQVVFEKLGAGWQEDQRLDETDQVFIWSTRESFDEWYKALFGLPGSSQFQYPLKVGM